MNQPAAAPPALNFQTLSEQIEVSRCTVQSLRTEAKGTRELLASGQVPASFQERFAADAVTLDAAADILEGRLGLMEKLLTTQFGGPPKFEERASASEGG